MDLQPLNYASECSMRKHFCTLPGVSAPYGRHEPLGGAKPDVAGSNWNAGTQALSMSSGRARGRRSSRGRGASNSHFGPGYAML